MTEFSDVEAAAARLDGVAVRTPLFEAVDLGESLGGRVLIKPENLQRTGYFKIRGAYNLMCQLSPEQKARGVVAWSSGNHAQGVASAGRLLGIRTAIVMPADAPAAKLANTKKLGGEVITYDRYTGDREAIARTLAAERGAELVPSYDHAHIIAGQGTVGLEIAEDALAMDLPPDQVLICCSGGGLASGSSLALRALCPGVHVHTVEPEAFNDTALSLAAGSRVSVPATGRSICDALQAPTPGELTFEILKRGGDAGVAVPDDEVRAAMRYAFRHFKMVVEPGGAVALAALLSGRVAAKNRTTVVVLSGGNVDPELFAEIQAEPN